MPIRTRAQALVFILAVFCIPHPAQAIPDSSEIADQEVLSDTSPSTRDTFKPGERWPDAMGAGVDPPPPPAAPILEGIEWIGNSPLPSATGKFNMSNSTGYADLGIHCATDNPPAPSCAYSVSNSFFFPDQQTTAAGEIPELGVSQFDPTELLAELLQWKTFIQGLTAEATITSDIIGNSIDAKPVHPICDNAIPGPCITDLDGIDNDPLLGDNDGIAVIDINVGNDFKFDTSDWILQGSEGVLAIFRVLGNSNAFFGNSSILLGGGGIGGGSPTKPITSLGAILFKGSDQEGSSDEAFRVSSGILNGIAVWDLATVGDAGTVQINISNSQGCAQFTSSDVDVDDGRWNRCAGFVEGGGGAQFSVLEPSKLLLLGFGLLFLLNGVVRRYSRKQD